MTTETTTDTTAFTRVYLIGTIPYYRKRGSGVYVKVQYRGGRLSLTGVEGPMPSGDCHGGAGQIDMHWDDAYLDDLTLNTGWTMDMVRELRDIWQRWHLNDMRAGSPIQEAAVRGHKASGCECPRLDWYPHIKAVLAAEGVDPDPETEYSYGSAWLTEDIPTEVLDRLRGFPLANKAPEWV